jgi:hypothetical protein
VGAARGGQCRSRGDEEEFGVVAVKRGRPQAEGLYGEAGGACVAVVKVSDKLAADSRQDGSDDMAARAVRKRSAHFQLLLSS